MHDGPADGGPAEPLLASVEARAAAPSCDDDGPGPGALAARALAELLSPGGAPGDHLPGAAPWRAVVGDLHGRAVRLSARFPVSWRLATSSAVLVEEWVSSGAWAPALRAALAREGAGPAVLRDAPVVVALHLFALRPGDAPPADGGASLEGYPHVARLRVLLASDAPERAPGGAADLEAVVAAVERLLR